MKARKTKKKKKKKKIVCIRVFFRWSFVDMFSGEGLSTKLARYLNPTLLPRDSTQTIYKLPRNTPSLVWLIAGNSWCTPGIRSVIDHHDRNLRGRNQQRRRIKKDRKQRVNFGRVHGGGCNL
jgi:hypothetical protein